MGQPGLQVGTAFWDLLCDEYKISLDGKLEKQPNEDVMSYYPFFTQLRHRYSPRAIFVDTDPILIEEIRNGPHRNLFNRNRLNQLISGYESCSSNVIILNTE